MDKLKGYIDERYNSLAKFIQRIDQYKHNLNIRDNQNNNNRSSISTLTKYDVDSTDLSKVIIKDIVNYKNKEIKRIETEQQIIKHIENQEIDQPKDINTFFDTSLNCMKRIDEQYNYVEQLNGTVDDIVQLYKHFFTKQKETNKISEIDMIQQLNLFEKLPVFLIFFRWLIDISRIKFERIIYQKSQELMLDIKIAKKNIHSQYPENSIKQGSQDLFTSIKNPSIMNSRYEENSSLTKNRNKVRLSVDGRIQTDGFFPSNNKFTNLNLSSEDFLNYLHTINKQTTKKPSSITPCQGKTLKDILGQSTENTSKSINRKFSKLVSSLTSGTVNVNIPKNSQSVSTNRKQKKSQQDSSDENQNPCFDINMVNINPEINQFKDTNIPKNNETNFQNNPYKIIINDQNGNIENKYNIKFKKERNSNIEYASNLVSDKNQNLNFIKIKIFSEKGDQYLNEQTEKYNQNITSFTSTSSAYKKSKGSKQSFSAQKYNSNNQESFSTDKILENSVNDEDKTKTLSFEKTSSNFRKTNNTHQNHRYHKFKRGSSQYVGSSVNLSYQNLSISEQSNFNGRRYETNYQKYLFENNGNVNKKYGKIKVNMHNPDYKNILDLDNSQKVFHYHMKKNLSLQNNEVSENGKTILLNQLLQRNQTIKQTISQYYLSTQLKLTQQINQTTSPNVISIRSNSNNEMKDRKPPTSSQKKNRRNSGLISISQTTPISQLQSRMSQNPKGVHQSFDSNIIELSQGNQCVAVFSNMQNTNKQKSINMTNNINELNYINKLNEKIYKVHNINDNQNIIQSFQDQNQNLDRIQINQLNSHNQVLNEKNQFNEKSLDSNLNFTSKKSVVKLQNLNKRVDFEFDSSIQLTNLISIEAKQNFSQDMIFRSIKKEKQLAQRDQRVNTVGHESPKKQETQFGKMSKIQNYCNSSQKRPSTSFMSYPINVDLSYNKQFEFRKSKDSINLQSNQYTSNQVLSIKNPKLVINQSPSIKIPYQSNSPLPRQNVIKQQQDFSSCKISQQELKQQQLQQLNIQQLHLQQLQLQQLQQQQLNQQQIFQQQVFMPNEQISSNKTQQPCIKNTPMIPPTYQPNSLNLNIRSIVNNYKQQCQGQQSQKNQTNQYNQSTGKQRVQTEASNTQSVERDIQLNYFSNKNHRRRTNSQRNNENLFQLCKQDAIGISITNMNQITDFSNQVTSKAGSKPNSQNNKSISYSKQLMQIQENSINFTPPPFTNQEILTKIENSQQYQSQQFQVVAQTGNTNNSINHYNKLIQKIAYR